MQSDGARDRKAFSAIALLGLAVMAACPACPGAEETNRGRVRGTVVDEQNRPIEGAWIYVLVSRQGQVLLGGQRILAWQKIGSARQPIFDSVGDDRYGPGRSGADGAFTVTGTPPLRAGTVSVYHPAHLPEALPGIEWLSRGREVDVGRVMLGCGESVEGEVTNEEDRPVAGAFVGVQKVYRARSHYDDAWRAIGRRPDTDVADDERYVLHSMLRRGLGHVRAVRADGGGHYRFTGLEPGRYLIAAWTDELPPVAHEIELPGPSAGLRQDFVLSPGESLSVVVAYTHTGEPYPGALVVIRPRGPTMDEPVAARARTDASGRCAFQHLKPGEYYVTAIPPDRIGERGRHPRGFSATNAFNTGDEGHLALEPITPVTGTVVSADGGKPVPLFSADLKRVWQETPPSRASRTRADLYRRENAGGRFAFEDARPGPWKLEIQASGFFPKVVDLNVPETGLAEPLRVELQPGVGKTRGLVLDDSTGGPLEGVEVKNHERFKRLMWTNARKAVTDGAGRYSLDGVLGTSDSRYVFFGRAGYVGARLEPDAKKPFPQELPPVRLVRCGSITGIVSDADGRPAEGYVVRLRRLDKWHKFSPEAKADAKGRFVFGDVPPGRYGVSPLKKEVRLRPGETVEVEIRLPAREGGPAEAF